MNKIILLMICILGLLLRVYSFDTITFAYDQARDAIVSQEIFTTDPIKLHGPRTDIEHVYHGPLYWYLIAPVYHFTNGNIFAVKWFLLLINLAGIPLIYTLTIKLVGDKRVGYLSAFLYAVSFEIIQFSRWLSNPSPALITSLFALIFFIDYLKQKNLNKLGLALFFCGLSAQLELFLLYQFFLLFGIGLIYSNFKITFPKPKDLIKLLGFTMSALAPFILAELSFKFESSRALLHQTLGTTSPSFFDQFERWAERLVLNIHYSIGGVNHVLSGILAIIVVFLLVDAYKSKRTLATTTLLFWSLGTAIIYLFTGTNGIFVNIGSQISLYIFFAILLSRAYTANKYIALLLFGLIFYGNLKLITSKNKYGEILFSVQNQTLLSDQLKLMDFIYKRQGKEPFSINTITNPLFTNTTWAYLFNWYGQKTYGYMPTWKGEPQVGVFGSKITFPTVSTKSFYLIIEPGPGIPEEYVCGIQRFENLRSKLVARYKIGEHEVQYRELFDNDYSYMGNSVGDYTKYTPTVCSDIKKTLPNYTSP